MSHRGPLQWMGWIGLATVLTGVVPAPAVAGWSEWMPLNRERGVWTRWEESPRAHEARVHYQFRNDSDQAAVIDCALSFYVVAPPTYKRVTEVWLTLFPRALSDETRFVRGDLLTADCRVSVFDPQPNWAEMASHETNSGAERSAP